VPSGHGLPGYGRHALPIPGRWMSFGVWQQCHIKVLFERKPWIRATRAWRKRSIENVETR